MNYRIVNTTNEFRKYYFLLIEKIYPTQWWARKKNTLIDPTFFFCGLILENENEPIASAAVYFNPGLQYNNCSTACFGNVECLENEQAFRELVQTISIVAGKAGKEILIGPINGSTWAEYKWATNSFEESYVTDILHPFYYSAFARNAGLVPLAEYFSHKDVSLNFDYLKLCKAQKFVEATGLTFRNINLDNYENELDKLYAFCSDSFRNNFLYSSIGRDEFKEMYRPMKKFINPAHVFMAADEDDIFKGLVFSIDNFSDTNKKGVILKTLAKSPGKKYSGLGTVLAAMLYERLKKEKYDYVIHAFMHNNNASKNISENFSGLPFKQYALFHKNLKKELYEYCKPV